MALYTQMLGSVPGVFIATLTTSLICQSPSLNKGDLMKFGLTIMGRTAVGTACVGLAFFAAALVSQRNSIDDTNYTETLQLFTYNSAITAFSFMAGFAAKKFPQFRLGTPLEGVVHIALSGPIGLVSSFILNNLVSQGRSDKK